MTRSNQGPIDGNPSNYRQESDTDKIRDALIENAWPDFVLSENGLLVPKKHELIVNGEEFFVDQALYIADKQDIKFDEPASKGLFKYFDEGIKLARKFYKGLSEQLRNILESSLSLNKLFQHRTIDLHLMYQLSHSLKAIFQSTIKPYDVFSFEQDSLHCRKSVVIGSVFAPFLMVENDLDKHIIKDVQYNGEFISDNTYCPNEKALALAINRDFHGVYGITSELKREILRRQKLS